MKSCTTISSIYLPESQNVVTGDSSSDTFRACSFQPNWIPHTPTIFLQDPSQRHVQNPIRVFLRLSQNTHPNRCDIEATLTDGLTRPLHIACSSGYEKAATLLLEHKADINARGANGHRPLHLAAKEGRPLLVDVSPKDVPRNLARVSTSRMVLIADRIGSGASR